VVAPEDGGVPPSSDAFRGEVEENADTVCVKIIRTVARLNIIIICLIIDHIVSSFVISGACYFLFPFLV